MVALPEAETAVRVQINNRLRLQGWTFGSAHSGQGVFVLANADPGVPTTQQSLSSRHVSDYIFFVDNEPVAVLEASKPNVSLRDSLSLGESFANRVGVGFVFVCNGVSFKTLYLETGEPLYLNEAEIVDPVAPSLLKQFSEAGTNRLLTTDDRVVTSRDDLVAVFEKMNDALRSVGARSGLDRFAEFANILFLKLLSENNSSSEYWGELTRTNPEKLPTLVNGFLFDEFKKTYGDGLLSGTQLDGATLKKLINELDALRLLDVDDDIKGVAFEYFLRRTTAGQNDLGEYFTPRHIVRFMIRVLNPDPCKKIFDPFCGTGGFLIEAYRHLAQQTSMSEHTSPESLSSHLLYGREITTNARLAKMNMVLFGGDHSGITQGDSLTSRERSIYDYVVSNIPFSVKRDAGIVASVDPIAKDQDEACLMACFNSLSEGGAMAVIVPEGLVVNRSHEKLWEYLCQHSRILSVVSLPRGSFLPYTNAGARIVFLADKSRAKTEWFYSVDLSRNDSITMEEFEFFYWDTDKPLSGLPFGVDVIKMSDRHTRAGLRASPVWEVASTVETVALGDVAELRNGVSITKAKASQGPYPVIGGGRNTVPYTHNESNARGNCFTISKSGAYAGYLWWHHNPIWASDSIVVRSYSEDRFMTLYIFLCMKSKQDEIYARQQGTGQPHVYLEHVRNFPIPDVSLAEQKRFVAHAGNAMSRYFEAAQKKDKAIRNALSGITMLYDQRETDLS